MALGFDSISEEAISSLPGAAAPTAYTLTADGGSYALTGQAATLTYNRVLSADGGLYALTGQPASLIYGQVYVLDAQGATYSLSSPDATLLYNRVMAAAGATYALTGGDVSFGKVYTLNADGGVYAYTGGAAAFTYTRRRLRGFLTILHNSADITDVTPGGAPAYVPGFEMVPAARSDAVQGLPGRMLQIRQDGVDIGNDRPAVLDLIFPAASATATRGVGQNSHILTLRKLPPADPFGDSVIFLMQNGEIVDRSPYARSLAVSGTAGSATAGAASDFPGGLAVSMQCAPSLTGGLVMGAGPELTMGEDSWCMEAFVTPRSGANGLQDSSQVLYTSSDDRSRLQWFLLFNTGRMYVRCNGFDIPAPLTVPFAARGSSWYCAVQFYPGSVVPWMWVGAVGDANATGDETATVTPRPLLGPLTGPYIGYQPTDNFITSSYNVAMRITNAQRFAQVASIPIPTALWPIP